MESLSPQPIYSLAQNKKRVLVPKIVSLLILGAIFYLGILLNISLLNLSGKEESLVRLVSLTLLALLIAFGTYLTIRQASQPIQFFNDKIVVGKKELSYTEMEEISLTKNVLDRVFGTYGLCLGRNFYLRNIPEEVQLENYLRQLIDYSRKKLYPK